MKLTKQNLTTLIIILIAFFIPVWPFFIPTALIILAVLLVSFPKLKERILKNSDQRIATLLFIFPWIFVLLGLLWSSNLEHGFTDVLLKITLFLFPILFWLLPDEILTQKLRRNVMTAYISGTFLITIILISRSFSRYIEDGQIEHFLYTRLSWYNHPTYIAMFMVFAVATLLYYLFETPKETKKSHMVIGVLLILWFHLMIVLLQSKAGWIGLIMVYVVYFGNRALMYKKPIISILASIFCCVLFWLTISMFPSLSSRLDSAVNVISSENEVTTQNTSSTAVRLQIWGSATKLIADNFFFGVGTGDVIDELNTYYEADNLDFIKGKKMNAHNQYIQNFISVGFLGVICLLLCFIYPFLRSIKRGNILYTLFLLIVFINLLFESALERQSGVYFYAFFNALFFYTHFDKRIKDEDTIQ